MQCAYCLTDFHAELSSGRFNFANEARLAGEKSGTNQFWAWHAIVCSKCHGPHIFINIGKFVGPGQERLVESRMVHPKAGAFARAPSEVPASIAADFTEANEVLSISPKASAALSRRCLQSILLSQGYTNRDLVKQVEAVLAETNTAKSLPQSLRETIDAVRNFGNFSAHPITDETTLQVVEVEAGEAEWCLQIISDLFEFYYVSPARAAAKRAALSAKLAGAGKPAMKQ